MRAEKRKARITCTQGEGYRSSTLFAQWDMYACRMEAKGKRSIAPTQRRRSYTPGYKSTQVRALPAGAVADLHAERTREGSVRRICGVLADGDDRRASNRFITARRGAHYEPEPREQPM